MNAKFAVPAFLLACFVGIRYAYIHGYPPFTSQFVKTCEVATKDRLADPSLYQRIAVEESRKTISWDEFFAEPARAVSKDVQEAMIRSARVPPVQYIAVIDYQGQDAVGAVMRERATCTFNSLQGDDAPTRTYWVKVDGEYNIAWVKRQPNPGTFLKRVIEH
ncbi:MAG: hypothetical protein U1E61_10895 [Bradyrhizobium sp.]